MSKSGGYITRKAPIDMGKVFPELAKSKKSTVRLHPMPAKNLPLESSKIGGAFLWPKDEPWPTSDEPQEPMSVASKDKDGVTVVGQCLKQNRTLIPILQLMKLDVPELGFPKGKDIFQILWNPRDHKRFGYAPFLKVVWRARKDIKSLLQEMPKPEYPDRTLVPVQCAVFPELVEEFPSPYELPDEFCNKIDQWEKKTFHECAYQYSYSSAPGIKVGGHVHWHQDAKKVSCSCKRKMELLVTITGHEYDGGSEARWKPSWVDAAGKVKTTKWSPCPTGMSVGRSGSVFVFICRTCPEWPIRWILDS